MSLPWPSSSFPCHTSLHFSLFWYVPFLSMSPLGGLIIQHIAKCFFCIAFIIWLIIFFGYFSTSWHNWTSFFRVREAFEVSHNQKATFEQLLILSQNGGSKQEDFVKDTGFRYHFKSMGAGISVSDLLFLQRLNKQKLNTLKATTQNKLQIE